MYVSVLLFYHTFYRKSSLMLEYIRSINQRKEPIFRTGNTLGALLYIF